MLLILLRTAGFDHHLRESALSCQNRTVTCAPQMGTYLLVYPAQHVRHQIGKAFVSSQQRNTCLSGGSESRSHLTRATRSSPRAMSGSEVAWPAGRKSSRTCAVTKPACKIGHRISCVALKHRCKPLQAPSAADLDCNSTRISQSARILLEHCQLIRALHYKCRC